jgi:hypothetical protein
MLKINEYQEIFSKALMTARYRFRNRERGISRLNIFRKIARPGLWKMPVEMKSGKG